jgi:hypothetical protein
MAGAVKRRGCRQPVWANERKPRRDIACAGIESNTVTDGRIALATVQAAHDGNSGAADLRDQSRLNPDVESRANVGKAFGFIHGSVARQPERLWSGYDIPVWSRSLRLFTARVCGSMVQRRPGQSVLAGRLAKYAVRLVADGHTLAPQRPIAMESGCLAIGREPARPRRGLVLAKRTGRSVAPLAAR